jgi:hypothetical protein
MDTNHDTIEKCVQHIETSPESMGSHYIPIFGVEVMGVEVEDEAGVSWVWRTLN